MGYGVIPAIEPMSITRAGESGPHAACNMGSKARVSKNGVVTLRANMRAHCFSGNVSIFSPHETPELLTRMSMWDRIHFRALRFD